MAFRQSGPVGAERFVFFRGYPWMSRFHDDILSNLDLREKVILDAAVGTTNTTWFWARAVHDQGGRSRILAVDRNFDGGWPDKIRRRLGDYGL